MRRDAGCWSDGYSFSTCCFAQHRPCFDELFTFERCCLVPISEIRDELAQFHLSWLSSSGGISNLDHVCGASACSVFRTWTKSRGGRVPHRKGKVLHQRAIHYLKQLRKPFRNFTGLAGQLLPAIAQLLAYYSARLTLLDTRSVSWGFPPAKVATPSAKWLLKQEARTWKRLRDSIKLARSGQFEICSCAGQGYDVLLASRDNVKRLWLHHPHFVESLVDPNQQAHHFSVMQSCVDSEEMLVAFSNFELTLSKTNCVAGDVATNMAIAQACLLQRQWARAAELYFLSFALVVAAPWTDCLDQKFWDISAEDVVYNVARLAGLAGAKMQDDAFLTPAEAVRMLGWRQSPSGPSARSAGSARSARLLPWTGRHCKGPRVLSRACLGRGQLHVLPEDFEGASAALCSEFGAFDTTPWISTLGSAEERRGQSRELLPGSLYVFPVGTPYPNLWHALHWWVPTLALKQEHGWDPSHTHVGIVFDSKLRNGQRWDVDRPFSTDTERFLSFHDAILRLLSHHPIRFVAHEVNMSCFTAATVGFRSFRYDMVTTQIRHQDLEAFRNSFHAAANMQRGPSELEKGLNGFLPRVLMIQREPGQARSITNLAKMQSILRRNPDFVTDIQQLESSSLLEQFSMVSQASRTAVTM